MTLLALAALFGGVPIGEAPRPNIVVLPCDDLVYGDLACFGHPRIQTPEIDRLASEGARLTCLYAGAPVCSPSRAALFSGMNPNRLGIRDWIDLDSGVHLPLGFFSGVGRLGALVRSSCSPWGLPGSIDSSGVEPHRAGGAGPLSSDEVTGDGMARVRSPGGTRRGCLRPACRCRGSAGCRCGAPGYLLVAGSAPLRPRCIRRSGGAATRRGTRGSRGGLMVRLD
jgi:hypothetical protein